MVKTKLVFLQCLSHVTFSNLQGFIFMIHELILTYAVIISHDKYRQILDASSQLENCQINADENYEMNEYDRVREI
ncbi:CLUMA_CG003062, isoform A [Clunio marinus]|uniref:CLUMA_CG003062, isoform A n=1 Tax=Clunio marinus TaxID=568069 RepID=A0A1J1HMM5_9DIPT|nr:CLUMA_CG003062, isoform A [Clunio marinus]